MMKETNKATDPAQYDSLNWAVTGAEENPSRKWFRAALDQLVPADALRGRHVVDIGCGVGQLFNWLKSRGSVEVWGFDPSPKNSALAAHTYPWAHVSQATLHEFAAGNAEHFAAATAVMVLEYVPNINDAFEEVASLLEKGAVFYLIVGDYEYFTSSDLSVRGNTVVSVEVVRPAVDGGAEVRTVRNDPGAGETSMYEIFRPIELVRAAARSAGFEVERELPMPGLPRQDGSPTVACHTLALIKT